MGAALWAGTSVRAKAWRGSCCRASDRAILLSAVACRSSLGLCALLQDRARQRYHLHVHANARLPRLRGHHCGLGTRPIASSTFAARFTFFRALLIKSTRSQPLTSLSTRPPFSKRASICEPRSPLAIRLWCPQVPKDLRKIPGPDPQYQDICYEGPGVHQDNLGAIDERHEGEVMMQGTESFLHGLSCICYPRLHALVDWWLMLLLLLSNCSQRTSIQRWCCSWAT